jgi:hypothetical protein
MVLKRQYELNLERKVFFTHLARLLAASGRRK